MATKFKVEMHTTRAKQPFNARVMKGGKEIWRTSEGYEKRGPRDKAAKELVDAINSGSLATAKLVDLNPPELGKAPAAGKATTKTKAAAASA